MFRKKKKNVFAGESATTGAVYNIMYKTTAKSNKYIYFYVVHKSYADRTPSHKNIKRIKKTVPDASVERYFADALLYTGCAR